MKTFTIDLSVTSSSERRWLSWVALKRLSLKWIDLQAKTTVILPHRKKLMFIVVIGGSVRMWWISVRCRQGVNLTSRKHCRLCIASRKRRTRRTMKIGRTVLPHGGDGKLPGGITIMRLHHKDGVTTDWTGKLVFPVDQLFICGMNLSKNLMHKIYRDHIGNSQRSLLSQTGSVKSTSSTTENGYENCTYSTNINTSDEDNKHDTNYINKHKYNEPRHAQAAPLSTARRARRLRSTPLDVVSHTPHWLKMFLSLTSIHLHAWASLFDLTFFPFYFDLTFSVFFHFSVLMHRDLRTDLDNLDTMQHNLRNSAKESNDAYDVTVSLTDRPGRPDIDTQEGAWPQQFVIGNDEAELDSSVESRSFVNWVNDRVRKRQKIISNVAGDGEEHSLNCHVYGCNDGISSIQWERITWTFVNPLWIQRISHFNTCSTW